MLPAGAGSRAPSALVRHLGEVVPVGQLVFIRSPFATLPVAVIYALGGELDDGGAHRPSAGPSRPRSAQRGGMFSNFSVLVRLPLADVTAIQFALPLFTVALAAVILKERVRIYRWTAVGIGFVEVIVMLVPHFEPSQYAAIGVPPPRSVRCSL